MAKIRLASAMLYVDLTPSDRFMTFHGSFSIPLTHVTNAYVSGREALHLQWRLLGTSFPNAVTAGTFTSPDGLVFCDIRGAHDCLVIELRNEHYIRLALQMDDGVKPNDVAHAICRQIP
ncbi:MAG: hypothetical protein GIW97_06905 [Candidatus Eremiobacteraeota bacterium]|nr:hypothetical protein [Candidatus Eremiobacteraeota bacterium]